MLKSIVVTNDELIREESVQIVREVGDIRVDFFDDFGQINFKNLDYDYLLILLSDLNSDFQNKAAFITRNLAHATLVFYNHSLSVDNLSDLTDSGKIRLIIGEHRKENLRKLLIELKSKHWKHIPLEKFDIDRAKVSKRIIDAVNFVEMSEIRSCSTVNIAKHLGISSGYFSQEFKRETGFSFRTFMQKVLNYYEETILSKGSISTKSISQILGYSELSSFSRSFKKRQGISPSEFRKKVKN